MNSSSILVIAASVAAFTVTLGVLACSPASNAASALGKTGSPADDEMVPDDSTYDVTECVEFSDELPCGGYYVLACCDSSSCAYIVTDGETGAATFVCASTSDCEAAGQELLDYCGYGDSGGGWDTGY
ncbi:MAG: hypothetical protein FJ102_12125 [Deltaproteobacteria bacterium]|nr:hypothetical protein [Deltaproteobacteria bacterium]